MRACVRGHRWASLHRGFLTLYAGKACGFKRIGRFTMVANEKVNLSAMPWTEPDDSTDVRGEGLNAGPRD